VEKADLRLIPAPLGYIYGHRELSLNCGFIILEEDVDKAVVKVDNKRSKGDKVPIGDNRGAT